MTRWLSSLLWYAAISVAILRASRVQGVTTDRNDAIPIFAGIVSRNALPPVAGEEPTATTSAGAAVSSSQGKFASIDPLEFSPDDSIPPQSPSPSPAATPLVTSTTSSTTTTSTADPASNSTSATANATASDPASSPAAAATATARKCEDGQDQMSIENVPGVFCVHGPRICSGSLRDGNCPGVQEGLLLGSYCGVVSTGVYGCRPGPKPG